MSTLGRDGPNAARALVAAAFGVAVAICIGVSVEWTYAPPRQLIDTIISLLPAKE